MLEITVPGSKSISNRALILNHLCGNKTQLHNIAKSTDSDYLIQCLEQIDKPETTELYTHNAGTTTRFITALATLKNKNLKINGDKRMQQRPIAPLVNALNDLGAQTNTQTNCPPVQISPQKLQGGKTTLPGNISSQYLSALLLVTPFAAQDSIIEIQGELCSKPYINITLKVLAAFGLTATHQNYQIFHIPGQQQPTPPKEYYIEPDASSASYPAAYAALHPSKPVHLKGLHAQSIQGDIAFLDHLNKMGCQINNTSSGTTITGPNKLNALGAVDMNATPDIAMTFAILAAFANGKTEIINIPNLKIKETDRLLALKQELQKLGANVTTTNESITITGPTTTNPNIAIETYDDHRMAMCFAILQDMVKDLTIKDPDCVEKSYKTFWSDLKKLQNEQP